MADRKEQGIYRLMREAAVEKLDEAFDLLKSVRQPVREREDDRVEALRLLWEARRRLGGGDADDDQGALRQVHGRDVTAAGGGNASGRVTLQMLATALRDLSGAAALFEQNPDDRSRGPLNQANDYAEWLLEAFVAQEGDIRPERLD